MAWREFRKGKRKKIDVLQFEFKLEDNLFQLHQELKCKTYRHSYYTVFNVCDPKLRRIHKAMVRDRVLHHAIFRILYPLFDQSFIFDSYSCRIGKGTHRAVLRLESFCRKARGHQMSFLDIRCPKSGNIFALKCDIKKFFESVDQDILLKLIRHKIKDRNSLWLIEKIIRSFPKGLPLGNVTSQLFANIYLNELDQFIKHNLKEKHYLRYCDDFIVLRGNKNHLQKLIPKIDDFLQISLCLKLHPDKIIIRKLSQGIDFLGYVILLHHRVLRTKTKKRIFRKLYSKNEELQNGTISEESFNQSLQSYLGVLKHCSSWKIKEKLQELPSFQKNN